MFRKLTMCFSRSREKSKSKTPISSTDSSHSTHMAKHIMPQEHPTRVPGHAPHPQRVDTTAILTDVSDDPDVFAELHEIQAKALEQARKGRSKVRADTNYSIMPEGHQETVAWVKQPNDPNTLSKLLAARDAAARRKHARSFKGFNLTRTLPDPVPATNLPRLPEFDEVSDRFVSLEESVAQEMSLTLSAAESLDELHGEDISSSSDDEDTIVEGGQVYSNALGILFPRDEGETSDSSSTEILGEGEGKATDTPSTDITVEDEGKTADTSPNDIQGKGKGKSIGPPATDNSDDGAPPTLSWESNWSDSDSDSEYSDTDDPAENEVSGSGPAPDDGDSEPTESDYEAAERAYRARRQAAQRAAQEAAQKVGGEVAEAIAQDVAQVAQPSPQVLSPRPTRPSILPPPGTSLSEIDVFAAAWSASNASIQHSSPPRSPAPSPTFAPAPSPPTTPPPPFPLPEPLKHRPRGEIPWSCAAATSRFSYIKSFLNLPPDLPPVQILLSLIHHHRNASYHAAQRNAAFLRAGMDIDWAGILSSLPPPGGERVALMNWHVVKTFLDYDQGFVFRMRGSDGGVVYLEERGDSERFTWDELVERERAKEVRVEIRDGEIWSRVHDKEQGSGGRRRKFRPRKTKLGHVSTPPLDGGEWK